VPEVQNADQEDRGGRTGNALLPEVPEIAFSKIPKQSEGYYNRKKSAEHSMAFSRCLFD
jgi:hypothetical protein